MNIKQVKSFALDIDPDMSNWTIVTGPRRSKFLFHKKNIAAWTINGNMLPPEQAFKLCFSYAIFSQNCKPL